MKVLILSSLILSSFCATAQASTYDIISYTPPKDWQLEEKENLIIYSRIDGGSWAQIAIYKSINSQGNIEADFEKEWNDIVRTQFELSKEEKEQPATADGWSVMSGGGTWQFNGANVLSLLTTYSNGNVCISVLCNATAKPYLKNYKDFIKSISLHIQPANQPADEDH
ncbi:hypothetical protein JMG10_04165 [Nostoc ellipsosporum NOK]|nr:hypothetical protein [Nostoc ellipsosporum NOK]